MQKYVMNKTEKICKKIFSGFREISIFVVDYFFWPHPVYIYIYIYIYIFYIYIYVYIYIYINI